MMKVRGPLYTEAVRQQGAKKNIWT